MKKIKIVTGASYGDEGKGLAMDYFASRAEGGTVNVLTNGGPFHSTEVPSTLMIDMLFLRNRYGMGSAIAVLLIILCFAFALIINRVFKEEE